MVVLHGNLERISIAIIVAVIVVDECEDRFPTLVR
jgi:hypothetical protein